MQKIIISFIFAELVLLVVGYPVDPESNILKVKDLDTAETFWDVFSTGGRGYSGWGTGVQPNYGYGGYGVGYYGDAGTGYGNYAPSGYYGTNGNYGSYGNYGGNYGNGYYKKVPVYAGYVSPSPQPTYENYGLHGGHGFGKYGKY